MDWIRFDSIRYIILLTHGNEKCCTSIVGKPRCSFGRLDPSLDPVPRAREIMLVTNLVPEASRPITEYIFSGNIFDLRTTPAVLIVVVVGTIEIGVLSLVVAG